MTSLLILFACHADGQEAAGEIGFRGELAAEDADALAVGTQDPGDDNGGLGEDVDVFHSSGGQPMVALRRNAGTVPIDAEGTVPVQAADVLTTAPSGDTLVGGTHSVTFGDFPLVSLFPLGNFSGEGATLGCMCKDTDLQSGVWLIGVSDSDSGVRFDTKVFSLPESDAAWWDWAGSDVGDTDGDGLSDLVVSVWAETAKGYFVPGSASGEGSFAAAVEFSSSEYNLVGQHVSAAGDTDGDGVSEYFVAGSNWDWSRDGGYGGGGAAFLLHGTPAAEVAASAGLQAIIEGDAGGYQVGGPFGVVQGIGDNDGDGYADVLIGSTAEPSAENFYPGKFLTGIFHGPIDGVLRFADAPIVLRGDLDGDPVQCTDHAFGDFDDDGQMDLLLANYLFLGPIGGSGLASDLAAASFAESAAGYSLGDFDGDGVDDLAVTDPAWTGASEEGLPLFGRVQFWYGR